MTSGWRAGRALRAGVLGLLALSACTATVGTAGPAIPTNAAHICARYCQTIGMRLSAVAIMASNVGCICQYPSGAAGSEGAAGTLSTPAAGMATIVMQEHARRQHQQQQRSSTSSVRR